jgi:hypothetical protein
LREKQCHCMYLNVTLAAGSLRCFRASLTHGQTVPSVRSK